MCEELLSIGDKMSALLGIACDGGTGYREFQCEVELDGCVDDGIEAEDLLLAVGILRVSANPDAGILIRGQFGAAKEERVGFCAVTQDDAGDEAPFDNKIEPCPLKLFLEAEDLVKDAGFVGICLLKAKGEDFHPGSWDMGRESVRRAVCLDADFFAHDNPGRISKAIKDPVVDVADDALELDHLAVFAEISAALVSGIGWEEGAVGSQDSEGEES